MGASCAASIIALASCGIAEGAAELSNDATSRLAHDATSENAQQEEFEEEAFSPNALRVGQTPMAVGPNIWNQSDLNSATIMQLVCPSAVAFDDKGRKYCLLTEEPVANYDASVWTITLKEGLRWNDGKPVTSEDVLFGAKYGVDNHLGSSRTYYGDVNFYSSEAVDSRTVRFVLNSPNPNFWNGAGYWIPFMRKSIWEKVSNPGSYSLDYPGDGYGPYYIKEWKSGKYVLLARNAFYSQNGGRGASTDEVVFRFYTDEVDAVSALERGEIDVIANSLSDEVAKQLAGNLDYLVDSIGTLGYSMLSFSQNVPALQDKEVRQAIARCINRDNICTNAYNGRAKPMRTPVSPVYADLVEANIKQPDFHIGAAQAQLEMAGYVDSGDGVRARGDDRLEFKLTYKSTLAHADEVADILIADLAKAGIKVVKDPVDAAGFTEKVVGNHEYELSYSSWGTVDDVDTSLITCFGIGKSLNFMQFESWEQESLLQAMMYEPDYERRKELLDRWQEWFVDNLPCVHIAVPTRTYVTSTERFSGWSLTLGNSGFLSCASMQDVRMP